MDARSTTQESMKSSAWLHKHLASVRFDFVEIVPYGYSKNNFAKNIDDVLFDDEENNRKNWSGKAYDVNNILEIFKIF